VLRGRPTSEILGFYKELVESSPGYEGYSEPTLKREVVRTVSALPGERVVDLGCGPNPVVLFRLAEAGKRDLTAVELSPDFCAKAEEQAERHGVQLRVRCAQVDETGLPDASFDVAILTEVLEHVPDELELPTLREVHRLLVPGGHFVVSVPNAASLLDRWVAWRHGAVEQHPHHLRDYDHDRLAGVLREAGFELVRPLRVLATDRPPWQSGASWLIDRLTIRPQWSIKAAFLARKPA
jgi:SAM-dependent methyltransferase